MFDCHDPEAAAQSTHIQYRPCLHASLPDLPDGLTQSPAGRSVANAALDPGAISDAPTHKTRPESLVEITSARPVP